MTWNFLTSVITLGILAFAESTGVTCFCSEDCVLPCRFQPAGEEVIYWHSAGLLGQTKTNTLVHGFYYDRDQLEMQDQTFTGRTSLFQDQIGSGNASLLLRKCKIQDSGKYKCYVSTSSGSQESSVNVEVKGPIKWVNMEMSSNQMCCSSRHIYPAPEVTWAIDPPTTLGTLQPLTHKTPDSLGLFTVESTVRILGNISHHTYFCSFAFADGSQIWTSSLRYQGNMSGSEGQGLTIPCRSPRDIQNFTLTWTFLRSNETVVILTLNSQTREISNSWEKRALVDPAQALSGNGSLQLINLEGPEHEGIYTCTFTALQTSHMIRTHVNITGVETKTDRNQESVIRHQWVLSVPVVFFIAILLCFICRAMSNSKEANETVTPECG